MEKIKALADFLQVEENEAEELIEAGDYLVLTDAEADEAAAEEIKSSLWAFNADFVLQHNRKMRAAPYDEWYAALDALRKAQERTCESANGLVYALIDDLEKFIVDAINADGRGHFISFYDGKENEAGGFFIYRIN